MLKTIKGTQIVDACKVLNSFSLGNVKLGGFLEPNKEKKSVIYLKQVMMFACSDKKKGFLK